MGRLKERGMSRSVALFGLIVGMLAWTSVGQSVDGPPPYIREFGSYGRGPGQFQQPWGIAQDGSGSIFVMDENNNRVQKLADTGDFIAEWGSPGFDPGQFNNGRQLAVDDAGFVYVADLLAMFRNSATVGPTWQHLARTVRPVVTFCTRRG